MKYLIRQYLFSLAVLCLSTGCATTISTSNHGKGYHLASQIKNFVGSPYSYGGNDPSGFDCSGLMQYTHYKLGIKIPRTTKAQLHRSSPIKLAQMSYGDLIFFRLNRNKNLHVGMYVGNNHMVHAPSSNKNVDFAELDKSYWRPRIIAIGRFF